MKKKAKIVEPVEEVVVEVVVESGACVDCNGSGLKDQDNLCVSCEGHGK